MCVSPSQRADFRGCHTHPSRDKIAVNTNVCVCVPGAAVPSFGADRANEDP